jgi:hypothetical protein
MAIIYLNEEAGKRAYMQDVENMPLYPDGKPRKTWDELPEFAKKSWIKNPYPRFGKEAYKQ